jgi:hypothetical protein
MRMTGLARTPKRLRRLLALAGSALMLAAFVPGALGSPSAAAATAAKPALCIGQKATGPFTTGSKDGKPVVFQGGKNKGKLFVSYGTTVPGLEVGTWPTPANNSQKARKAAQNAINAIVQKKDEPKIRATALYWCGNTVRLQVNQDLLVGKTASSYLNAIETEIRYAESYGLVVVLSDSTESSVNKNSELGPTAQTLKFWQEMTKIYGHGKAANQVIFDLFNEPRVYNSTTPPTLAWVLWYEGTSRRIRFGNSTYIGMEILAQYVRTTLGAANLFWVEGPYYSASFAGMYPVFTLTVSNVVYAIHHPAGWPDRTSWYFAFGYLINRDIAPVVEGEWTNFEPAHKACPVILGITVCPSPPNNLSTCWPNAPYSVPVFLQYLLAHGVGMSAYQLSQDVLILNNLTKHPSVLDPTKIVSGSWNCIPWLQRTPYNEGAGMLIQSWFKANNAAP